MAIRKERSDKGQPRRAYKKKRTILLTSDDVSTVINWPRNAPFSFNALYAQDRLWLDDVSELRSRDKEPNPGIYYRNRWETKGEFVARKLTELMVLTQKDINNFRSLLPGKEDSAIQTVEAPQRYANPFVELKHKVLEAETVGIPLNHPDIETIRDWADDNEVNTLQGEESPLMFFSLVTDDLTTAISDHTTLTTNSNTQ